MFVRLINSSKLYLCTKNGCIKLLRRNMVKEATVETSENELYRLTEGPETQTKLTVEDAMYALRNMYYIRRVEAKGAQFYKSRLINGFCHLYTGQEAVAVGTKMSLQQDDTIITAYRCHGFAMIFGTSARKCLAELMGRKTGISKGRGGSMHMYCEKFYGGEGIVGGQVPIGTGIGFAHKYLENDAVSFTFYGDGAASQGQVFEAWNMAKLWNLPVVYICENNLYGMGTATHRHSANTKFYARGDLIPGFKVDGMKVIDVREAIKFARDYALKNGPIILEMVTYRYYGHSMSDPGTAYRTRDEIKAVQVKEDPIMLFRNLVIEKGLKTEEEIEALKVAVYNEVDKEAEEAQKDPQPDTSELCENCYVKPLEKIRGKAPWQIY